MVYKMDRFGTDLDQQLNGKLSEVKEICTVWREWLRPKSCSIRQYLLLIENTTMDVTNKHLEWMKRFRDLEFIQARIQEREIKRVPSVKSTFRFTYRSGIAILQRDSRW